MRMRDMQESDVEKARGIHAQFYANEFPFPDFSNNFLATHVVEGDDGTLITAGGIRTILESVLITNKSLSPRTRRHALLNMLEAAGFYAGNYDSLHAFIINDDNWLNQLKTIGFDDCKGKAVYLRLR